MHSMMNEVRCEPNLFLTLYFLILILIFTHIKINIGSNGRRNAKIIGMLIHGLKNELCVHCG